MSSWTLLWSHVYIDKWVTRWQSSRVLGKCFLTSFLLFRTVQSPLQSIREDMQFQPWAPVCSLVPRVSPGPGYCWNSLDLERGSSHCKTGRWIRLWICWKQDEGNDYSMHNDWITILKWNELDSYYQCNYSQMCLIIHNYSEAYYFPDCHKWSLRPITIRFWSRDLMSITPSVLVNPELGLWPDSIGSPLCHLAL